MAITISILLSFSFICYIIDTCINIYTKYKGLKNARKLTDIFGGLFK